jgi:hypothetical protein
MRSVLRRIVLLPLAGYSLRLGRSASGTADKLSLQDRHIAARAMDDTQEPGISRAVPDGPCGDGATGIIGGTLVAVEAR